VLLIADLVEAPTDRPRTREDGLTGLVADAESWRWWRGGGDYRAINGVRAREASPLIAASKGNSNHANGGDDVDGLMCGTTT